MKIYTIHGRADANATDMKAIRFVKEGFSWLAFLAPVIWLLYHRLWLASAIFIAVSAVVAFGLNYSGAGDALGFGFGLLLNLFAGLEANQWYRTKLVKRGFTELDVAAGETLEAAELAYFQKHAVMTDGPRPTVKRQAPLQPTADISAEGIGLFPAGGG